MQRLLAENRELVKAEMRAQIKAVSNEIHDLLIGLGVLEGEEIVYTKRQVCQKYMVSKSKVEYMMADGTLPFKKLGDSKQARVVFRPADCRIAFEDTIR